MTDLVYDQYRTCETTCTHDLARGVLVDKELRRKDGPFEDHPLLMPPAIVVAARRARATVISNAT